MKPVTVVKIGGVLLESPAAAVARILAIEAGALVVVHGGGVQITRALEKMNVKSQFIDGLRVTDALTLQTVAGALLGEVHTALVTAFQSAGVAAMGVFGAITAEQKSGPWGLVGTNVQAKRAMLRSVIEGAHIPVIPTLAVGPSSLLNVNGDETAAAVAVALAADRLVFMTDVEGVLDGDGQVILRVPREVSLLNAPFVSGGMKPKLRAVEAALAGGVDSVSVGRTVFGSSQ